jgi:type IV secretory pathway protease TraF
LECLGERAGWLEFRGETPPQDQRNRAHPSIICRFGSHVFADGKRVAKAKTVDKVGRLLQVWKGCRRLGMSPNFVLGKCIGLFDSRYYGPIHAGQAIGIAKRMNIFGK